MKNFEMIVKDIFYLTDGRMVFAGQFINDDSVHLPMNVSVYVNEKYVGKIQLTMLPFSSGKNVRKNVDVIEASKQIDLKFIDWKKDSVRLSALLDNNFHNLRASISEDSGNHSEKQG